MFGVAFSELAILFSLVAALGLSPAGASSDKLEMAYVAPDECVVWLTWNGWKAPDRTAPIARSGCWPKSR